MTKQAAILLLVIGLVILIASGVFTGLSHAETIALGDGSPSPSPLPPGHTYNPGL